MFPSFIVSDANYDSITCNSDLLWPLPRCNEDPDCRNPRGFRIAILKYTDMNDLNSAYFQRQTRTYNDSDRHKVKCILAPKVNSFKNSFFVRSARSWNSLPADIRSHDSIDSFKANLEKYFWNSLFPPD